MLTKSSIVMKKWINETLQNKYLIDKYNPIHFIKRNLIIREVKKITRLETIHRIADLGCGTGMIARELSKLGKVDGYDINSTSVGLAKKLSKSNNTFFYLRDIFDIEKRNYDLVVCSEVLEYLPDDLSALRKMNQILRPKGYILLTVPVNKYFATEFDQREKFRRYSLNELVSKLKKTNFKIKKTRYWGHPLLNLFYRYIYIPKSNREANKKIKEYKLSKLTLSLLKYLRYIFLIDLLFNNKNSFDLLVIAQKKP